MTVSILDADGFVGSVDAAAGAAPPSARPVLAPACAHRHQRRRAAPGPAVRRPVCRSLRSFTSDPLFVAEHTARHPLLVANFRNDEVHIRVFDLLGNVVKP